MAGSGKDDDLSLENFLDKVIEDSSKLAGKVDPNKRLQQERLQIVVLTVVTAAICVLAFLAIYG